MSPIMALPLPPPVVLPSAPPPYLSNPLIPGFITSLLWNEVIRRIPALPDPSPQQSDEIRWLSQEIYRLGYHQLERFFMLRALRKQRLRRNQGLEEMRRLVDSQLSRFSDMAPSPSDPRIEGVHPDELRSLLPDFSKPIDFLLTSPPFTPFGQEDALVISMAKWFKSSFMRWCDPIKCPDCGGATASSGSAEPNRIELQDGAGRVEVHSCSMKGCGGIRRFARYNSIRTLLRTREGRCGEWAHLFYAFLLAAGLEARYIWNSEDHVWNEYWSPSRQHWVHVDSCEAAVNKPLLYALGWGKKQAFCIAVGPYGAEDVTRVYVDDRNGACRDRRAARGWKDSRLARALLHHTVRVRLRYDATERARLRTMDLMQVVYAAAEKRRLDEARSDELGGRVSGPEEWRAKRRELGLESLQKPAYKVLNSPGPSDEKVELLGDAKRMAEGYQLTSGSSQISAIFFARPISQSQSIRLAVKFKLLSEGSGEADGFGVVFSGEKRLGKGGYGLGYTGLGGDGDFAVEVDTYRSQDTADDPPVPHISVHCPPNAHHHYSIACTPKDSIPYLSDGKVYTLELLYDGSKRGLFVSLKDEGEGEEMRLFQVVVPPRQRRREEAEWYIGITGSCGGLWQVQDILEWTVEDIEFE
ncbi:peptide-N4-(N-acetyl-beta-glucosaminyl)asparagine amidase, partial [Tremellales sp. Uapishka_1]